jgi:hypothetical protein
VLCVKLFQGLGQQLADADGLVALALFYLHITNHPGPCACQSDSK